MTHIYKEFKHTIGAFSKEALTLNEKVVTLDEDSLLVQHSLEGS